MICFVSKVRLHILLPRLVRDSVGITGIVSFFRFLVKQPPSVSFHPGPLVPDIVLVGSELRVLVMIRLVPCFFLSFLNKMGFLFLVPSVDRPFPSRWLAGWSGLPGKRPRGGRMIRNSFFCIVSPSRRRAGR